MPRCTAIALLLTCVAVAASGCGASDRARQVKRGADTLHYAARTSAAVARYALAIEQVTTPYGTAAGPGGAAAEPEPASGPSSENDPTDDARAVGSAAPTSAELGTAAAGAADAADRLADVGPPERARAQHAQVVTDIRAVATRLRAAAAASATIAASRSRCLACRRRRAADARRLHAALVQVDAADARVQADLRLLARAIGTDIA